MRQDCARWLVAMTLLMSGCDNSAPNAHTSTAPTSSWPSDSPLPKGKLNAGSTVTINSTTESPAQVLSPATSGNSLYRPLNHSVGPGDQVSGKVTLSSDTPLQVRLFLARHDQSSWEASQYDVTIGPTPTTYTILHTFQSPHQDARLQIALQSNADTLMVHDATVQLIPSSSCDWQVIAVSTLPDPETADYPNCLDVLHLKRSDSCDEPHEALVALQTMTDRILTSAANIKLGDLLTIDTLTPWNETPDSVRSIRTVQDMDEFHLPMFFGDGSKIVGKQSATATANQARPIATPEVGEFLTPAPSEDQKQWIANDLATINQIAAEHGGWKKWADSLDSFRSDLRRTVSEKVTLIGEDWIAALGGVNWLHRSELCRKPNNEMIYPKATETIIDTAAKLNARGIDLIVIPVPPRAEVMPEKFGGEPTELVAPQRYRFMKQLLLNGVEVVDVLPAMLDAKANATAEDPVVFAANRHWASRGLHAAAATLAPRISRYQQADQPLAIPPLTIGTTPTDPYLWDQISEDVQNQSRTAWPIREVQFRSVEPDTHGGPAVLLISDSYGSVHKRERGDFGRHVSAMSGVPIDKLTASGSGPLGPTILARNNGKALTDRPAVVWLFVAKCLGRPEWRPALPAYRPHWQQDSPLPKGKINADSAVKTDVTATPDADEFLAPAPSEDQKQWIANDVETIQQIAADHGGWQEWSDSLDGFRSELRRIVPDEVTLLSDEWLASRGNSHWLHDSAMCQKPNEEPIYSKATETIIDTAAKLNARGIDLIVIPVPPRAEVMPEKFGGEPKQLVAPHRYRFMQQLLDSGVEVVDVLPAMMAAKQGESRDDPVVFAADPHWASRGLYAAAMAVSPRLYRYRSESLDIASEPPIYRSTPESLALLKDATSDLQEMWKRHNVVAREARPTTSERPLLLVSDSYGTIHSNVHGDFTKHLSELTGLPIHRVSEGGGGPRTPTILARNSAALLNDRPVVIWLFVARYLPDRRPWKSSL